MPKEISSSGQLRCLRLPGRQKRNFISGERLQGLSGPVSSPSLPWDGCVLPTWHPASLPAQSCFLRFLEVQILRRCLLWAPYGSPRSQGTDLATLASPPAKRAQSPTSAPLPPIPTRRQDTTLLRKQSSRARLPCGKPGLRRHQLSERVSAPISLSQEMGVRIIALG